MKLVIVAVLFLLALNANASLVGRLPATPGGTDYQAYYDTVLGITWLTDTKAGAGSAFDDSTGGTVTDGVMNWANASAWAASLTLGGFTDWRLPNADRNGNGLLANCRVNTSDICTDNEFSHLFWVEGISLSSPSPFNNVTIGYWFGTEFSEGQAWNFNLNGGEQSVLNEVNGSNAWAVRTGDVSAIPIPAAAWLFGSGLLVLAGLSRRKA